MPRHQLLVTLDVKHEAFDTYVSAMRDEEVGARSEDGNLGFDLWGDAKSADVIWLLEYWASESALTVDHAERPYYRHVRGLEAESLTGEFEERLLVELGTASQQTPGAEKSVGAPALHITVWSEMPEKLVAAFDEGAMAVRGATGNRFWQLYANARRDGEAVLIEAWASEAARAEAGQLSDVLAMRVQALNGGAEQIVVNKI